MGKVGRKSGSSVASGKSKDTDDKPNTRKRPQRKSVENFYKKIRSINYEEEEELEEIPHKSDDDPNDTENVKVEEYDIEDEDFDDDDNSDDVDDDDDEEDEDDDESSKKNGKSMKKSNKRPLKDKKKKRYLWSPRELGIDYGAFLVLRKDLTRDESCEQISIWRVDGKALLQKYEPEKINGKVFHKATQVYTGWGSDDARTYKLISIASKDHKMQTVMVNIKDPVENSKQGQDPLKVKPKSNK